MKRQAPTQTKGIKELHQKQGVYLFWAYERGFRHAQRGFSLIEMLVVISIIALILGVGTGVALRMNAEARRVQTREMMQGLLAVNDEYKKVRQSTAIGVDSGSSSSSAEQFVAASLTVPTCENIMLTALNSSSQAAFERTYKNGSIFDRWGTEIEYRSSNDGSGTGPSTGVSNSDLPISRDPFFASAGPDETFGTDDDITTRD